MDKNESKLDSILDIIQQTLFELKDERRRGKDRIKAACEYIRHDIDVATESRIEALRKFNYELIDKVNAYEKECLRKLETDDSKGEKIFKETLKDNQKLQQYWQNK
jgi:hypothetical protein